MAGVRLVSQDALWGFEGQSQRGGGGRRRGAERGVRLWGYLVFLWVMAGKFRDDCYLFPTIGLGWSSWSTGWMNVDTVAEISVRLPVTTGR